MTAGDDRRAVSLMLANGCVCREMRGDLVDTLRDGRIRSRLGRVVRCIG
jgi:hypothetical protein